jgi:hypothetical protein
MEKLAKNGEKGQNCYPLSQGGGTSYQVATKYDIEGHHCNPAIIITALTDA